jgi:nucleotide-binding universal stress UspA family protein
MNLGRKILVPVDFSEDSASGLKFALSVARKTDAELVVLHVAQKSEADCFLDVVAAMEGAPMLNTSARIPVDKLLREKALDLYNFIEKVVRNPGRVTIRRKVALGNEAEKILRTANEELIDLVVLTFRKQSFFRHIMARARFLRVIARMPCPVLLTPALDERLPGFGVADSSLFAR